MFRASAAAPAEEVQQHLGQERQSPDVFCDVMVIMMIPVGARLRPRVLPMQTHNNTATRVSSLLCRAKRRMFHTPIDQGRWRSQEQHQASSIIPPTHFFPPTQGANGSPPPGDKINQTRSSILILCAEQPPGAALPGSVTAVELGEEEEQWLYPQLFLLRGEMFGTELRTAAGRSHRMG